MSTEANKNPSPPVPSQGPKNKVVGLVKKCLERYFGKDRLALATILFISSYTVIEVVVSHLGIHLPISDTLFQIPLAIGALVGYYLPRHSSSRAWLIGSASLVVICFPAYYYFLMIFVGITLMKIIVLEVLLGLAFGALYAALRILINQGLH